MNFCEYCGTPVIPGSKFCAGCGHPFSETDQVSAAQPRIPAHVIPADALFASAKKFALLSLILLGSGALLRILFMILFNIVLRNYGGYYMGNFGATVEDLLLLGILPFLTMRFAASRTQSAAKPLLTAAVCLLGLQAAGEIFGLLHSIVASFSNSGGLYEATEFIYNLFVSIPGTELFYSMLYHPFGGFLMFMADTAACLAELCYIAVNIFCILAIKKLAKS